MDLELLVTDPTGKRVAVWVRGGRDATVDEVAAAVAAATGWPPGPLFLHDRRLPAAVPVHEAGLVSGAEVGYRAPTAGSEAWTAPRSGRPQLELAVVGGLEAGRRLPTGPGQALTVGRDGGADLIVADPEVSRVHARVVVGADDAELVDAGSRNGVRWRGYRLEGTARCTFGDAAQVGETVLALRRAVPVAQPLALDPDAGVLRFDRPPRTPPGQRTVELAVPTPPDNPRNRRFPLATILLPLLLAGVIYAVVPRTGAYLLLFLALSPLMVVANVVGDRRSGRKDLAAQAGYERELATLDTRLAELVAAEERAARDALPDPAAVCAIAAGPTGRLWERRPTDPDFGRLRVGLVDRPSTVRLVGRGADDRGPAYARLVPAAVDLAAVGVLGMVAPRRTVRAVLAHAAVLHAPDDLGIVLLTGRDRAAAWEWLTWLPHTRPASVAWDCRRLVATDAAQAEARLAELRRLIDERRGEQPLALRDQPPADRRYLVVVDGARRLRALRGLTEVLRDGPTVGVFALCLDADEASLPDECLATVVADPASPTRATLRTPAREPLPDTPPDASPDVLPDVLPDALPDVLLDGMAAGSAAELGRALTSVRIPGGDADDSAVQTAPLRRPTAPSATPVVAVPRRVSELGLPVERLAEP